MVRAGKDIVKGVVTNVRAVLVSKNSDQWGSSCGSGILVNIDVYVIGYRGIIRIFTPAIDGTITLDSI